MEVQSMQTVSVKSEATWTKAIQVFARDIKLSHSIFALPFVGVSLILNGFKSVSVAQLCLIVLCMVLARSFAMGMNRYLDRDIDIDNVRTKSRAIPAGEVSSGRYLMITLAFGFAFVAAAFQLSSLAGYLSPMLLMVLMAYSFMKRWTWLTHWYLGVCLGLAPIAAEIALYGVVTTPTVLLGSAVAFWTAGFDLLYSLQDREFDQAKGLHSAPAKLGFRMAIWLSRGSFVLMTGLLFWVGVLHDVGYLWNLGVAVVGVILLVEQWIVRDAMITGTSQKINMAFFNLNALVSVAFFAFALADYYARH